MRSTSPLPPIAPRLANLAEWCIVAFSCVFSVGIWIRAAIKLNQCVGVSFTHLATLRPECKLATLRPECKLDSLRPECRIALTRSKYYGHVLRDVVLVGKPLCLSATLAVALVNPLLRGFSYVHFLRSAYKKRLCECRFTCGCPWLSICTQQNSNFSDSTALSLRPAARPSVPVSVVTSWLSTVTALMQVLATMPRTWFALRFPTLKRSLSQYDYLPR